MHVRLGSVCLGLVLFSVCLLGTILNLITLSFVEVKCHTEQRNFRTAVLISGQARTLTMDYEDEQFPKGLEHMIVNAEFPSLDFMEGKAPVAASFHRFLYTSLQDFDVFVMISIPSNIGEEVQKQRTDAYCNALKPLKETNQISCEARTDIALAYNRSEIMRNFYFEGNPTYENGLMQQLYGLHYVNEMRKEHERNTGIQYTHMVRVRTDIIFAQELPPLQSLDFGRIGARKVLYASRSCCCGNEDWFGLGTVDVMDHYFSRISLLFLTFDAHWRQNVWTAESFLVSFLDRHNAKLVSSSQIFACVVKPKNRTEVSQF